MKNKIKYLTILAFGMIACEQEFNKPITDADFYSSGDADFSKYVAVGNSLTAGYADGSLYITGQNNSYPNILANQLKQAGGGEFTQPLMADNAGGLLMNGTVITGFENRFVLNKEKLPVRYTGSNPTTDLAEPLTGKGPFNNMGVPGAKSFHLIADGYGNIDGVQPQLANPYFVRFASSPTTSVIQDAVAQKPTFFSLWIGNNDILSYATSGGIGDDHNATGNMDPKTYGEDDITNNTVFAGVYSKLVEALVATGAKGVLINLANVTSIPYFTTVPNNALVLDATQAANLTGFFKAFTGIATVVLMSPPHNIPAAQAQMIASQYALTFNEGPNKFLIKETSATNPFGFRQMTDEELLLLTIDRGALAQGYGSVKLTPEVLQALGILQAGGTLTPAQGALVINAVSAIEDKDALDKMELTAISTAQASYNATIKGLATANKLAFYDAAADLAQVANGGIPFDGGVVTDKFATGGGFSLDGVHPTPRGYAMVANGMIKVIESTYKAKLPSINPGDYGTITLYNKVN